MVCVLGGGETVLKKIVIRQVSYTHMLRTGF